MKEWLTPAPWLVLLESTEQFWDVQVIIPSVVAQLVLIAGIFLIARWIAPGVRNLLKKTERVSARVPAFTRVFTAIESVSITVSWLAMQWLAIGLANKMEWPHQILTSTASLLSAWIVIRIFSHWFDNPFWSRLIALSAWSVAALNILGLLPATAETLDTLAITIGTVRISMLTMLQGGFTLGLFLWLAVGLSGIIEKRLRMASSVSPAARVLIGKFARIALVSIAVLVAINTLGIDLTALAVLSGALAVGLGFGLQKIFSNLVSGVILLMDKSIKPGDVIALGQTYGWIDHLGARYVSVVTRDGVEHLIPNEELIIQRVENWSHSNNLLRLRIPVGVSYKSDPRLAMQLCMEAAEMVPRVLLDPPPNCLLRAFGTSSIDLELRFWVSDPENGRGNVISEILLGVWDRFQEHGVEIPFPQQDVHLRSLVGESAATHLTKPIKADDVEGSMQ